MPPSSPTDIMSLTRKISQSVVAPANDKIIALLQEIAADLVGPPDPTQEMLYQYTTVSGLRGMVSNDELWATPVGYLNDTSEYHYGRELVSTFTKDQIRSLEKETASSLEPDRSRLKEILERINKLLDMTEPNDVFVACFTFNGDQLSQWRGYGADGYGYAVGFEASKFTEIESAPLFMNVLYEANQQDEFCKKFVKRSADILVDIMAAEETAIKSILEEEGSAGYLAPILYAYGFHLALPMFKDRGFAEEKEFRASLMTDFAPALREKLKYHERKGMLVPHLPLKWRGGKLPIKEIILGPNLDFEKAGWSLKQFLKQHGYPEVRLRRSSIPYLA